MKYGSGAPAVLRMKAIFVKIAGASIAAIVNSCPDGEINCPLVRDFGCSPISQDTVEDRGESLVPKWFHNFCLENNYLPLGVQGDSENVRLKEKIVWQRNYERSNNGVEEQLL